MGLRVAIQMDPIESIDIDADSTFVLALEEYRRHSTGDPARYRTSVLLQELRDRLT